MNNVKNVGEGRFFKVVKGCPFVVRLPERSTKYSAGYDFFCPYPVAIAPGQTIKIKTWVKARFPRGEFLMICDRSSFGIKKHLTIPNGVGIIDSDYYGNENNDGNIIAALYNFGKEPVQINTGDKICQGIFIPFKVTDDDIATGERTGGVGSTGK